MAVGGVWHAFYRNLSRKGGEAGGETTEGHQLQVSRGLHWASSVSSHHGVRLHAPAALLPLRHTGKRGSAKPWPIVSFTLDLLSSLLWHIFHFGIRFMNWNLSSSCLASDNRWINYLHLFRTVLLLVSILRDTIPLHPCTPLTTFFLLERKPSDIKYENPDPLQRLRCHVVSLLLFDPFVALFWYILH